LETNEKENVKPIDYIPPYEMGSCSITSLLFELNKICIEIYDKGDKSKRTKLEILKNELSKCIKERMEGLRSPDDVLISIVRPLREFLNEHVLHTMTVSIVHDIFSKITVDYYKFSYSNIFRILLNEAKKKYKQS